MNILHLEASPGWGGQEMRILREAEGMRRKGHQVFLGVMKGGQLIHRAREAGFAVYELNFRKSGWIVTFLQLLWFIRKHQIAVVNTHSSLDAWIGGIAARAARVRIIRTRHLSAPIKPGINSRLLYGRLADFVVTTCASIIPMICKQSGKKRELCRSIPTGVDPSKIVCSEEAAEEFRRQLGVDEKQMLIGTACFMRSWKGIPDFLQAAHLLREEKGLRWVIIGGGHAETYKKMAAEMNLESIVFFTGHLENPFPALGSLDVFTLLSTANEGVSQAILQAAYLSKPLIATAVGGLGEVCIPGETGLQVNSFSPQEVANAVKAFQADPQMRVKMGQSAKKWVEKHFTIDQTIEGMERVYLS